jgi:hypothetical protein
VFVLVLVLVLVFMAEGTFVFPPLGQRRAWRRAWLPPMRPLLLVMFSFSMLLLYVLN